MANNQNTNQGQDQNSQGQQSGNQNANQGQSSNQPQSGTSKSGGNQGSSGQSNQQSGSQGQSSGDQQSGVGLGDLQGMMGNLPGMLQQVGSSLTGRLGKLSTTQKLLGLAAITLGANYLAKRTKANNKAATGNKNKGR